MKIVPFTVGVAEEMTEQQHRTVLGQHLRAAQVSKLVNPHAFAARQPDGQLIAACGVYEMWEGRAHAWALMTPQSGPEMLGITRAVRTWLLSQPFNRVEATVEYNFAAGHRWARFLGFELEAERMRAFGPDGEDHTLYAWVKEWQPSH